MRQIRKIVRDKRGEGYIDVAVMVLCVMLVIALGVRLFPIFITKMQVDNFADELAREAEISGRVGSETSNRQRVLEERTGIHPTVQWSRTGNLQLNEEVTVTVTIQKDLVMVMLVLVCSLMFGTTVCAAGTGDVAGAIEGTWKDASAQIKTVVNKVVFPAIDLILAVFFFAKLGTAYFDYRKHGQFEWAAPAILFACLVFTLTAPAYIWTILGM